jgi:hypothetical protein
MAQRIPLILSVPTSAGGDTAAATFAFFSGDYRPPRQGRSTASDTVHNQNGLFKYRYDNGPNVFEWQTFRIIVSDRFMNDGVGNTAIGSATQQLSHLDFLWNYVEGPLGFAAPEGVYSVDWAEAPLEKVFRGFPGAAGDKIDWDVSINFEEG